MCQRIFFIIVARFPKYFQVSGIEERSGKITDFWIFHFLKRLSELPTYIRSLNTLCLFGRDRCL